MAIKPYGHPASLCTRRVLLVLAEKGIDYEFINVNFIAGEQKGHGRLSDEIATQTRVTKLHAKLDVLDKILATQDYLGGAEFTVVGILYMPAMQMLRQAGQVCLRAACKLRFLVEESL
ncbi:hypothetical protein BFJ69_g10207 [Fusarium oxysporum]|uniref:glutathione transferase n=1 Tax=Fusarium oxysporum TaxID=5507 RepID=A0A420MW90_FUSOX|nr:hypothetical protein BFJ69_g10207 [Fusarium oxysporum]